MTTNMADGAAQPLVAEMAQMLFGERGLIAKPKGARLER